MNFLNDAAVSSGLAFLQGELERLDPVIRTPLGKSSYARDIKIITGGGWAQQISNYNVTYGIGGGILNLQGGIQNEIARIQANLSKDSIKTSLFQSAFSVKYVDLQFNKMTGRDIESMLEDGTRLLYDRYIDKAVYKGFPDQDIYGLVNHPSVTASNVAMNAGNTSRKWEDKTPQEIMNDINDAIETAWAATEYDDSAVPNHILIPPEQFALLQGTIMSVNGVITNASVLDYIKNNNMANTLGQYLEIYPCRHCIGAGTGGTDRMIVYNHDPRFIDFQIPVSLNRIGSDWNVQNLSFDTVYMSLVGSVRTHYTQPILYKDGI